MHYLHTTLYLYAILHHANIVVGDVISHLRMFWPACHLVRGKPRHSESNGGVERSNRTVEDKLGLWMSENKSQHWSVGLPLVQWEMNTQTHKGIGGNIPY